MCRRHLTGRALADAVGLAISNADRYEAARRLKRSATVSAEITARMLDASPVDAVALFAERLLALMEAECVCLCTITPGGTHLALQLFGRDPRRAPADEIPILDTFVERVCATNRPVRLAETELAASGVREPGAFGPLLGLPLDGSGRMLGAVVLARRSGARPFTDGDLALAADLVGRASLALWLRDVRVDRDADLPRSAGQFAHELQS